MISQNAVTSIKSCEIKSIQFRKPGPIVPTLIITFEVDAAADKMRKRRSSRSGQLTSSTSSYPNSLLFRTVPEERFNIYDWQVTIQPRIQPNTEFGEAISHDAAPTFNSFINPFAKSSKTSERPTISKPMFPRPEPYRRHSEAKDFSRERPSTSTLISPSPSLRSRRSDLSSQSSSVTRPQAYSTTLPIQQLPPDLPSPASTLGYEEQFISGWTSAQGRSSALSNHTRASASVSMAGTPPAPPAPRETILDRAFMLRYIPGSERAMAADEDGKMSSIARFEALMREHDQRRNAATPSSRPTTDYQHRRKDSASGWELEEETESDSESDIEPALPPVRRQDQERDPRQQKYYGADDREEDEDLGPSIHTIPNPAQRALEYISGRNMPAPALAPALHRPSSSKSARQPPPLPSAAQHAMPTRRARPTSLSLAPTNVCAPLHNASSLEVETGAAAAAVNRHSSVSTSAKRLSFTEFAKRLSSTSSLLLVQTNQSGGSARNSRGSNGSSDASFGFGEGVEEEGVGGLQRGLSQSRLSGMVQRKGGAAGERQEPVRLVRGTGEEEKRCTPGWRGSGLGVFGGEGGFL